MDFYKIYGNFVIGKCYTLKNSLTLKPQSDFIVNYLRARDWLWTEIGF